MEINRGYIYALVTVGLWTLVPLFIRFLLPVIRIELMLFFRLLLAGGFFFLVLFFRNTEWRLTWKKLAHFAPLGLLYTLQLYTYMVAVANTVVANVQFLQQISPVYTFLMAHYLLKERAKRHLYVSLVLALVGAFLIFQFNSSQFGSLLGNVSALISGICLAGYSIMSRKVGKKYSTSEATFWAFLFGALLMSFSLTGGVTSMPVDGWLLLAAFGVVSTGVPFFLYLNSLKYIQAQQGSLMVLLTAVTVPIAAFLVLGEIPTTGTIVGGAFILSAALLVIKS